LTYIFNYVIIQKEDASSCIEEYTLSSVKDDPILRHIWETTTSGDENMMQFAAGWDPLGTLLPRLRHRARYLCYRYLDPNNPVGGKGFLLLLLLTIGGLAASALPQ
jgi:hypothetical protein